MIKNKDIFFISSAWNTGTGFIIKGYDFIITTIQVVGFSKEVVVRHHKHGKFIAKVIFIDNSNGLVFLDFPFKNKSSIDILNFELAVVEQPVRVFRSDYNNELIYHSAEISNNLFAYSNFNHLLIELENHLKVSGAIITNNRNEIVGLTKFIEKENLFIGLPAKYLLKSMEEFSVVNKTSVRCPSCFNIVKNEIIIDNICPSCSANINDELLEDFIPKISKIDLNIEKTIVKLGYKIESTRLGRHFWEINEGSAIIFIRYEPKQKFIVAFSKLLDLKENKSLETYKYLLSENKNIGHLSFSIDKNSVFISAPYIFDDDFNEEYAQELFADLFKKADYYDDIIKIENG
jgi:serine protease Do